MRLIHRDWKKGFFLLIYLVVSTPLKNTSQNGNLPQVGVKIKNIWNNHLVCTSFFRGEFRIAIDLIYTKSSVTNKFNNLWLPRRFSREFFVCKKSGCTSVVCLNVWGWNWESWPWGSFCQIYASTWCRQRSTWCQMPWFRNMTTKYNKYSTKLSL